jgi:hypothetical protein
LNRPNYPRNPEPIPSTTLNKVASLPHANRTSNNPRPNIPKDENPVPTYSKGKSMSKVSFVQAPDNSKKTEATRVSLAEQILTNANIDSWIEYPQQMSSIQERKKILSNI